MKKKYKKRLTNTQIIKLLNDGLKITQIMLVGVSFRRIKKIIEKNNNNYKGKKNENIK
jgi:hypothetical protein